MHARVIALVFILTGSAASSSQDSSDRADRDALLPSRTAISPPFVNRRVSDRIQPSRRALRCSLCSAPELWRSQTATAARTGLRRLSTHGQTSQVATVAPVSNRDRHPNSRRGASREELGWRGRIRTFNPLIQNQMPYR